MAWILWCQVSLREPQPKQAYLNSFTAILTSEEERDNHLCSLQTNAAHPENWSKRMNETERSKHEVLPYPILREAKQIDCASRESTLSSLQLGTPDHCFSWSTQCCYPFQVTIWLAMPTCQKPGQPKTWYVHEASIISWKCEDIPP